MPVLKRLRLLSQIHRVVLKLTADGIMDILVWTLKRREKHFIGLKSEDCVEGRVKEILCVMRNSRDYESRVRGIDLR